MLNDELESRLEGKVAVVGVGDVRRGDDGVGPLVAELLAQAGVGDVIDSGVSPELDTWRLREMCPDSILFVDAAAFGGSPGDAALLSPADLRKSGFDTHRAPLKLTMEYLENDLGCRCCLLAVEPRDVRHGAPMCPEVRQSATDLTGVLVECLRTRTTLTADPSPSEGRGEQSALPPLALLRERGRG